MRRVFTLATLLAAALLPASAFADPVDFSVTGVDANATSYDLTFSFDPAVYTSGVAFKYPGVTVSGDGAPESADLQFFPEIDEEFLEISAQDFQLGFAFSANGLILPLAGDPTTGAAPVVTPGSYDGTYLCAASVTFPDATTGPLATLALLQMPTLSFNCGDVATLTVSSGTTPTPPTPPTAVTPEPATFALLGTGALGVIGVMRRRFRR